MNRSALLLACLLLAGCTNPEEEYQRRYQLAATQPAATFGFKLRVGTPRSHALWQLDSLRQHHALGIRVRHGGDSVVRLPFEPHPVFTADKLTGLQLVLPELDKWQWVGVLDSLRNVYGNHADRYPNEASWHWYWFAAGTEIDFGPYQASQPGQWVITYRLVVPSGNTAGKRSTL